MMSNTKSRALKEHNKFIEYRDRYGLTPQGYAILEELRFVLTGKNEHADKISKL
jgi:hypothetical protein